MSALNLSSLLVSTKETRVEYPGYPGFKVNVCFLSREELVKLRKKATKIVYKNRVATDELNEDLFLSLYVQATIKGWEGLKLSILPKLAPVDLTGHKDLEVTLDYTEENALFLMKSSTEFDAFISETVSDLANFQ